jgi:hypothetical protein
MSIQAALERAERFVEEEFINRQDSYLPDPADEDRDYIDDARLTLGMIREALAELRGAA